MIPVEAALTSTVIPMFLAFVLIHARAAVIPAVLRSTALMTTLYSLKLLLVQTQFETSSFKTFGVQGLGRKLLLGSNVAGFQTSRTLWRRTALTFWGLRLHCSHHQSCGFQAAGL